MEFFNVLKFSKKVCSELQS